jgi:ABC-type glycerol-3-phosphate transport system permease component
MNGRTYNNISRFQTKIKIVNFNIFKNLKDNFTIRKPQIFRNMKYKTFRIMAYIFLMDMAFVFIFPFLYMIVTSIKKW